MGLLGTHRELDAGPEFEPISVTSESILTPSASQLGQWGAVKSPHPGPVFGGNDLTAASSASSV